MAIKMIESENVKRVAFFVLRASDLDRILDHSDCSKNAKR